MTGAESSVPWYKYWDDDDEPPPDAAAAWTTAPIVVLTPPCVRNRVYTTAATREQEEEGTSLRVGARKEAPMARAGSISLVQQRQVLLRRWLWKTATPPTSKQVKFLQKVLLLVAEGPLQNVGCECWKRNLTQ